MLAMHFITLRLGAGIEAALGLDFLSPVEISNDQPGGSTITKTLQIFGVNILNPGLYGLVERAEVNIKALQTQQGTSSTAISGIETAITGINTTGNLQGETWADGDSLFLSDTIDGGITNVRPTAPSAAGSQSTCRVPTGSTPGTFWSGGPLFGCIPGGPTVIAQSYTYTTPDIWFSRHPLTITPCGADDPIDDEEESPP